MILFNTTTIIVIAMIIIVIVTILIFCRARETQRISYVRVGRRRVGRKNNHRALSSGDRIKRSLGINRTSIGTFIVGAGAEIINIRAVFIYSIRTRAHMSTRTARRVIIIITRRHITTCARTARENACKR